MGPTHLVSGNTLSERGSSGTSPGLVRSIGKLLRWRAIFISRHAFVAIAYNQRRTEDLSSKSPACCHARTKVSCTASSASDKQPKNRYQYQIRSARSIYRE